MVKSNLICPKQISLRMFIIRFGEATCWHLFARSNVARCHGWDSQLEMHTFQRASHFLQICKYSGRPLTLKYDGNVTIWKWEYKFSGSLWRGYKTWGTTQQETEKLIVRFILKHILFTLFTHFLIDFASAGILCGENFGFFTRQKTLLCADCNKAVCTKVSIYVREKITDLPKQLLKLFFSLHFT